MSAILCRVCNEAYPQPDHECPTSDKKDYPSIHYTHDVIVYIPCFQSMDAGYPSFTYSYGDATNDEQMAWSMKPDYVLTLTGKFDAKTQPYSKDVEMYNAGIRNVSPDSK